MTLLAAETGAGRLYEIDVRLRPDGGKGALVSSLASYRDYQRERAWTWEHQALVRARAVAGDAALCAAFAQVRADTLTRVRDTAVLHEDVRKMRARMRSELDRSDAGRLDLKQAPAAWSIWNSSCRPACSARPHSIRRCCWPAPRPP